MILAGGDIWFEGFRLAPDTCTIDPSIGFEEWAYVEADEETPAELPDYKLRVVVMGPTNAYLFDRLLADVDELERAEELGLFSHRVREELASPGCASDTLPAAP